MKVLLVYPDIRGDLRVRSTGYFYNGIASISSVLKQHGHDVRFLHYLTAPSREELEADLLRDPPELVGYSATSNLFPFVRTWSRWCRARLPETPQICGGIHPTLNRDRSLATSELNIVCVGEGEWPMVELCDHLDRGGSGFPKIANLTFKGPDRVLHRNDPRPLMTGKQLDVLPYADRLLFDPGQICDPNRPIVMASRGCPFNCHYCCNQALRAVLGSGNPVRLRSVTNVIDEIKHIRPHFPDTDGIHFDDDIFGLKLDWLREFTEAYRAEIGLPFSCNIRPTLAREEVVRLLADAGCDEVAMGVETGNPELRRRLLGRDMDNGVLIDAYRRFEDAGIVAHSFNMVGLPHETMANSLETVRLNATLKRKWRAQELRITIFYPYAGTQLYEEARQHGMLTDRNVTHYADDTTLNLDGLSRHQVRFAARYFRLLVMVYQRLLRKLGRPGHALAKWLDRLLLSTFAERFIFPPANALYPWAVRLARCLKLFERPGKPKRASATAPSREAERQPDHPQAEHAASVEPAR